MKRVSLSTMYGVGLVGIAPGTFGSLVAALLAFGALHLPFGYAIMASWCVILTVLGTYHAHRFMRDRHTAYDPKEIVIDEFVGQWLTYVVWFAWLYVIAGNHLTALRLLNEVASSPLYLGIGFALFRVFDILKPWPISWADRRIKGGFGVMFDDILAAIPAGTLLYVIYLFSPMLLGQQLEVSP